MTDSHGDTHYYVNLGWNPEDAFNVQATPGQPNLEIGWAYVLININRETGLMTIAPCCVARDDGDVT